MRTWFGHHLTLNACFATYDKWVQSLKWPFNTHQEANNYYHSRNVLLNYILEAAAALQHSTAIEALVRERCSKFRDASFQKCWGAIWPDKLRASSEDHNIHLLLQRTKKRRELKWNGRIGQCQPSAVSRKATPAMANGYKASTGNAVHAGNVLRVPVRIPTANVHATITVTCRKHNPKVSLWSSEEQFLVYQCQTS